MFSNIADVGGMQWCIHILNIKEELFSIRPVRDG